MVSSYARYRCIVYPLKKPIRKLTYGFVCALLVIIMYLANIHLLINLKSVILPDRGTVCDFNVSIQQLAAHALSSYVYDSLIPVVVMLFFYHKMARKTNQDERRNSFTLSNRSRLRNRRALRTIRGLIVLFTVSVVTVRVTMLILRIIVLDWGESTHIIIGMYFLIAHPFETLLFYSNNMLNVFIYAKMNSGFRRFLLTVFTCGVYGRGRMNKSVSTSNRTFRSTIND